jgi:hypothetical protein
MELDEHLPGSEVLSGNGLVATADEEVALTLGRLEGCRYIGGHWSGLGLDRHSEPEQDASPK